MRAYPSDRPYAALRVTLADAAVEAGLIPIPVCPDMGKQTIAWLYEHAAGIIFSGGTDWDPKLYHQAPAKETRKPQVRRDEMEQALFKKALADKKPILGICRGMQGLAIALYNLYKVSSDESLLIQEIAQVTHQRPTSLYGHMHRNKHEVMIAPGTLAHEIFQSPAIMMPERNHQAVNKNVAATLPHTIISGLSARNHLTEILELQRSVHPFCFAVQGHPEVDRTLYLPILQRLAKEAALFARRRDSLRN